MIKTLPLLLLLTICLSEDTPVARFAYGNMNLLPRQRAPFFSAIAVTPDLKFQKISLSDYSGKYIVLLFYPFDFTYVCPTELVAFSNAIDQFRALGAEILGISTDSHFTHLAWLKTPRNQGGVGDLQIPLLADISKKISKAYGVLVEDELDELYGASLRGLFIIDKKGLVRTMQINDAPVGRSVEETLRLIQAFQYTDTHGEVCPANWKPGQRTIVPDQDKKAEYFAKVNYDHIYQVNSTNKAFQSYIHFVFRLLNQAIIKSISEKFTFLSKSNVLNLQSILLIDLIFRFWCFIINFIIIICESHQQMIILIEHYINCLSLYYSYKKCLDY